MAEKYKYHCTPVPGTLCKEEAQWLVWFEKCGNLYTYMCTHHATEAMKNGVDGYAVICVCSFEDAVCLCMPDIEKAIEIFLNSVESAVGF